MTSLFFSDLGLILPGFLSFKRNLFKCLLDIHSFIGQIFLGPFSKTPMLILCLIVIPTKFPPEGHSPFTWAL